MEPISLILWLLLGAGVASVVLLSLKDIMDWFRARHNLLQSDRDNVAKTIVESLKNGHYKVVQGIFNTRTGRTLESRTMEAADLDSELARLHSGRREVIHVL